MSTKGARVRRTKHKVQGLIDQGRLALRMRSPKEEDQARATRGERRDRRVSHALPPLACMRHRLTSAHAERRVEQQHALLGPALQIAVRRERYAEIPIQLREDVAQAPRQGPHVRPDRKG